MAPIPVPFKITYGTFSVGGDSGTFRIPDQHRESIEFETITLEFEVQVIGATRTDFQNQCALIEEAFHKRNQSLSIDLNNIDDPAGVSTFTYTFGEDILNTRATIDKPGDEDDAGLSRMYSVVITGGLPSPDVDAAGLRTGLQNHSFGLSYEAGRQKRVTFTGIYTATGPQTDPVRAAQLARVNYEDPVTGADIEAGVYLAQFTGDVFEIVTEDVDPEDSSNHTIRFSRTYVEQLEDQTIGTRDAPEIRDHSFSMSESLDNPGDSDKNVNRLREVSARYECAVDIEVTTDLENVFRTKIDPFIVARFKSEFSPRQYAVRRREVAYDRTRMRISANLTFTYQKAGGENLTEISTSVRVTELQSIDWTPSHEDNVFAAELDKGWATKQRTTTVNSMVVGEERPENRIKSSVGGGSPESGGGKGGAGESVGISGVAGTEGLGGTPEGAGQWIEISTDREVTFHWIGDKRYQQILVTKLAEQKVEQYHEFPAGRRAVKFG